MHFILNPNGETAVAQTWRAQSHRTAPISDTNPKSQISMCPCGRWAVTRASHHALPRVWPLAGIAHRSQRNLYVLVYCVTKDVIKDTDEEPDEEVQGMSLERLQTQELPVELAGTGFLVYGGVHPPGNSQPQTSGLCMEACFPRHDQLLTPFPAPIPSLEDGRGRRGLKVPSH